MAKTEKEYSVLNPLKSSGYLSDMFVGEGEGYEKKMEPADKELTHLTEGNVPVTEADHNIRQINKRIGAEYNRVLGGFWDSVKGGSQNVWDLVRYQGDVPDEVLKQRAIEANEKLEALDAQKNQEILAEQSLSIKTSTYNADPTLGNVDWKKNIDGSASTLNVRQKPRGI